MSKLVSGMQMKISFFCDDFFGIVWIHHYNTSKVYIKVTSSGISVVTVTLFPNTKQHQPFCSAFLQDSSPLRAMHPTFKERG